METVHALNFFYALHTRQRRDGSGLRCPGMQARPSALSPRPPGSQTPPRFLKEFDGDVCFSEIEESDETVLALITGPRGIIRMSYMEDRARDMCCELALSLRDLLERNIFFDLTRGRLVVYLTEISDS